MLRRSSFLAIALTLIFGTATLGAAVKQSYVSGNFALDLEGKSAGFLTSVAGGFASGNVVEESESPDYFVKKHLEDPPAYSDITIEFGLGMSTGVYQWMKDVLDGNISLRKSGAISALGFNNKVVRRLDFSNAQITRITFPATNAASKNAATIRLTLTADSTSMSSPGNTYPGAGAAKPAKRLLASNFTFSIKGLDTSRVSSVGEIDIPIPLTARPDAACVSCEPVIPKINYPDVTIVGSEAFATTWFAWHQTFVIAGQHEDADEKFGTLDYLDSTLKGTLLSLSFTGLGITSISTDSDTIATVRASMYAEKITLTLLPPP